MEHTEDWHSAEAKESFKRQGWQGHHKSEEFEAEHGEIKSNSVAVFNYYYHPKLFCAVEDYLDRKLSGEDIITYNPDDTSQTIIEIGDTNFKGNFDSVVKMIGDSVLADEIKMGIGEGSYKDIKASREDKVDSITLHSNETYTVVIDGKEYIGVDHLQALELAGSTSNTIRGKILMEAKSATEGDRNRSYGSPAPNMRCFANLVDTYIKERFRIMGPDYVLNDVDGAVIMDFCKTSRIAVNQQHWDNYVDKTAYGAIAGECAFPGGKDNE